MDNCRGLLPLPEASESPRSEKKIPAGAQDWAHNLVYVSVFHLQYRTYNIANLP